MAAPIPTMDAPRGIGARALLHATAILLLACLFAILFAFANTLWFESLNGLLHLQNGLARVALYSSFPALLGGVVVLSRPRLYSIQWGDTGRHWLAVLVTLAFFVALTIFALAWMGSTPFSGVSPGNLLIEVLFVPLTEELLFRGVLLTLLVLALKRRYDEPTTIALAVLFNGIAFGVAHLANLTLLPAAFVVPQAFFAVLLGAGCAYLTAKCQSLAPALLLHAIVNLLVVLL